MLDIVSRRGLKALQHLLLVLEYDLPYAYTHVTKKEPRPPPDGKAQHVHRELAMFLNTTAPL